MDNIKQAILEASKKKRKRKNVKRVLNNIDSYAIRIRAMLLNKSYVPSPYTKCVIMDNCAGKTRIIYKPRFFPDQCIHWALMLKLTPLLMKGMYYHTCGSIPKRGGAHVEKYVKRWIKNDKKNTKYCLKMDIRKFYPSIDKQVLSNAFRRKLKDPNALWLIDKVIYSHEDSGIPIGNYTSQWFGNFLLTDLDHLIKESFHVKYYIRYLDDMVLFGPNKKVLHSVRRKICLWLKARKLRLKKNWQVFKMSCRGLDFLGLRFFYQDKVILRKRMARRIRRRIKRIHKKFVIFGRVNFHDACAIVSYLGWIIKTNCNLFKIRYFDPYVDLKYVKEVIRIESKKRQKTVACCC